jgi:1-acyl-sn-glycerol-3-phosphate acyltransferase
MSSNFIDRFSSEILLEIAEKYFEAQLDNSFEFLKYYKKRPIIIVGNHAGGGLSWDNIMFDALFYSHTKNRIGHGLKMKRLIHANLYNDKVKPFLMKNWWKEMDCFECTMSNFDELCQKNEIIYISPEGISGLTKGYDNKNELQRFSTSFVHMARKYNALIIPNCIVNSEYLLPFNFSFDFVNAISKKYFDLPFVTISPLLPLILIPKYFIIALPAKLKFLLLDPIEGSTLTESNEYHANEIKEIIQTELIKNDHGFFKGVHFKNIICSPFNKNTISISSLYKIFWEGRLNRPLTFYEKFIFNTPLVGYLVVDGKMNN